VVSRGYQRNFANGELILLVDKRFRQYTTVGTRDAFVERDFNSRRMPDDTWDDELEGEWRKAEHLLPALRRVGTSEELPTDRELIKPVIALHIARSYGFVELSTRIHDQVGSETGKRMGADPAMVRLYEQQVGHLAAEGEIEAYVAAHMQTIKEDRMLLIDRMANAYNWALQNFLPRLWLQVLHAPSPFEWVTGDSPVLVADKLGTRLLSRGQIAMGDSQTVYFPLTRHVAVTAWVGDPEPDTTPPPASRQQINWLMWRNCLRYVACHPSADPSRLLATRLTEGDFRRTAQGLDR
jgi:hypothetical protein